MKTILHICKRTKLNSGQMRLTFKKSNKVRLAGTPGNSGGEAEFRLLEDGFMRLLENDDFRILE